MLTEIHNIAQHTFVTISMGQVIFNYYVNEFLIYLFISERVLYGLFQRQGEKHGYFATYCTVKTCLYGKNQIKPVKLSPGKKVALELLHHRLGNRSTRLLMAGDTVHFWKIIEVRIDPDPFCTSCQISSMNKKSRSKNVLNPKATFKWVLWILFQQQHEMF